jgi:hypothetical protein
LVSRLL